MITAAYGCQEMMKKVSTIRSMSFQRLPFANVSHTVADQSITPKPEMGNITDYGGIKIQPKRETILLASSLGGHRGFSVQSGCRSAAKFSCLLTENSNKELKAGLLIGDGKSGELECR